MRALLQCLCFFIVMCAISCNEDASEIGSNFFDGGSLNMAAIDTISLNVATVKFDSMPTSDALRHLVGYHIDPDLGLISSSAFFEISPISAFSIDKLYTTYSRTEVRLVQDGYSSYDTTATLSFSVHEITKEMDISNNGYLYNTTKTRYDPVSMGSVSFKPRPASRDTVKVSLSDDFGRDVIRLAQSAAAEVQTTTAFVDYFNGLALIPDATNGPFVGFEKDVEVRVYYTDRSVTPSRERYLSLVTNLNLYYNQINTDRSLTKLSGLTDQRYAVSTLATDHKGYTQGGSGLGLRVSIPYLRDILVDNPGLSVVNARLEFSPTRDNKGDNLRLPQTLVLTAVDYRNQALGSAISQTALLYEDFYLGRDTHFEVDITTFIKEQLLTQEFNDNAIIFTPADTTLRSSIDRIYIGDRYNDREMKLTLTCLTYDK